MKCTNNSCRDCFFCRRWREVVGCPDVRAPPGGWAIRNDDSTSTLGCNQHDDVTVTSRTWQLVCVGHAWRVVGVTHNCTMTSYHHGTVPRQNVSLVVRSFVANSCLPLLNLVLINIITRSTGTVHTSAKAHLTSVAIRIRIRSRSVIWIATKD